MNLKRRLVDFAIRRPRRVNEHSEHATQVDGFKEAEVGVAALFGWLCRGEWNRSYFCISASAQLSRSSSSAQVQNEVVERIPSWDLQMARARSNQSRARL